MCGSAIIFNRNYDGFVGRAERNLPGKIDVLFDYFGWFDGKLTRRSLRFCVGSWIRFAIYLAPGIWARPDLILLLRCLRSCITRGVWIRFLIRERWLLVGSFCCRLRVRNALGDGWRLISFPLAKPNDGCCE